MINEEKQVISKLRESIEYDKQHRIEAIYDKEVIELRNNIELVLDLIEKLQKENEELKNKVIKRDNELIELDETSEKEFLTKQEVKENYIPKDKVKEKLKRPKDNIQVVYASRNYGKTNSIVKEYISKDKIREKIKELENSKENFNFKVSSEDIRRTIITKYKELLEEE